MGELLRALRLKSGLTQAQVAERIGLSRAAYTHIERGTKKPSLAVAMRLATLFGADVADLFGVDRGLVTRDRNEREGDSKL